MNQSEKNILLGRITAAHGIRGEVVVHSFASEPTDIASYGALTDKGGTRSFALTVVRDTGKGVICRIKGLTDRNAAEALRGTELYVARDKLPAPTGDEFYHADLIGLAAVDPDGKTIGTITGVHNFGAGDLIEIALEGASMTELIPFSDAFVPEIDLKTRRVIVRMPAEVDEDDDADDNDHPDLDGQQVDREGGIPETGNENKVPPRRKI